jgi:hypothetical protein
VDPNATGTLREVYPVVRIVGMADDLLVLLIPRVY